MNAESNTVEGNVNQRQAGTGRSESKRALEMMGSMAQRLRRGEKFREILGIELEELAVMEAHAFSLYRKGQYERAQTAALGILAMDSDRFIPQLIVGDVALATHNFREAVTHLRRAHELAPQELGVLARLGEALAKKGEKKEARAHLEAVISGAEKGASYLSRAEAILGAI